MERTCAIAITGFIRDAHANMDRTAYHAAPDALANACCDADPYTGFHAIAIAYANTYTATHAQAQNPRAYRHTGTHP